MKVSLSFFSLATAVVLWKARFSSAIEARPVPFTGLQPDGGRVVLMLHGNEFQHSLTDADGYSVEKNELGEYVYVNESDDGQAIKTSDLVGRVNPLDKGIKKGVKLTPTCSKRICGGAPDDDDDMEVGPTFPSRRRGLRPADQQNTQKPAVQPNVQKTTGTMKNLVVLLYFSDHAMQNRSVPTQAEVDVLMNADEPDPFLCPTGSLKGVYQEFSYGQLTIESTVTAWVTLSKSEAWYADGGSGSTNLHEGLREALDYLDQNSIIDFKDFDLDGNGLIDSIAFLHSGYGAEWGRDDCYGQPKESRIWSHKWKIWGNSKGQNEGPWKSKDGAVTVSNYFISPALWDTCGADIGRIGVIAHETGHYLGMPDLYDTDDSKGRGLGSYCLMSSSWGFDKSQYYPGFPSAYVRMKLGWSAPQAPLPGKNIVAHAEEESDGTPQIYIIGEEFGYPAGEYLLIEYRKQKGLDSLLPQAGLAIYHVDEKASLNNEGFPGQSQWPNNGNHYRVALLQADGLYDLETGENKGAVGDFFRGDGVNELLPSHDPLIGPFPNTDAYQGGKVYQTGVEIYNIQTSGKFMTFGFSYPYADTAPSREPSHQPSMLPSYSSSTPTSVNVV